MGEQPPAECPTPPEPHELAQVLGRLPLAVFVLDTAGRPCYANLAAQDLLGAGPGAAAHPGALAQAYGAYEAGTGELYPAERMPVVRALHGETSTVDDMELRVAGTATPIEVWAAPVVDDHGTPVFAAAAFTDTSARRRADAARDALAAIVESSDDAIISATLDRAITTWNPAAERIYGYAADEAIGMDGIVLVPAERRDEVADILDRVARGEQVDHLETVRLRKDGTAFPASLVVWPVKGATGDVVGATGIVRDLTERRVAEQQAGELAALKLVDEVTSDDRRRLVEAQRLAHLGSWETDVETGTTTWSEEVYRIVGEAPEGGPSADGPLDHAHPDDRARVGRELADAAANGRSGEAVYRVVRPGGEVRWVHHRQETGTSSTGVPLTLRGTVLDVTEVKRAEEDARARALQQEAVTRLGAQALAGADLDDLIEEAVRSVVSLLGDEFAAALEVGPDGALVLRAFVGREVPCDALDGRAASWLDSLQGRSFVVSGGAVAVSLVVHGGPWGVLMTDAGHDRVRSMQEVNFVRSMANVLSTAIERRRYEELRLAAQHRERLAAVGQAVAGVAHDFNGVLGAIRLYAELLGAGQALDDAGRQHVDAIAQQVERAGGLVWQILDFSNRRPLQREGVDVVAFLRDLLPVVDRALPSEVRVGLHHDAAPLRALADPVRLQQAVLNVVSNAGDAIDGPGRVDVSVSRDGRSIRIDVSDTGSGFSDEARARAFEPFFTTKPPGRRMGLGLAQVHALVSLHDGQVDIRSVAGEGTTVTIWLPEAASDGEVTAAPRPSAGRVTGGRGRNR